LEYCKRCVYPANAKPDIIFDEYGVCSGCRLIESRPQVDWDAREKILIGILEEHKARAKEEGRIYDCIIPVSGGKDSTYQTYLMKEKYGMNPLLVTYNHGFNTKLGMRNLSNLLEKLGCDLLRFSSNIKSVRKLTRYALKKMGDATWHYHAGIQTWPIKTAAQYRIPLMIWGEEGFSELTGMHNQDDMVEFTKKKRQEHSMRGFEPDDIIHDPDAIAEGITATDLAPYFYPPEELIEEVGVRGIYLSNFISWNARKQTELVIDKFGFETAQERDRTFNLYDKLEDMCANGIHDYLKYLKFGYGRATDDASTEIRHGRMTREEGIEMVKKHDSVRPRDLDLYLKFTGFTEAEFYGAVENMRDPAIWEKQDGKWVAKDSVTNHVNDPGVEEARRQLAPNREGFIRTEKSNYSRDSHLDENEYIYI